MKKLDMGEKPSKFLWEKVCREIDAGKLDKEEVKELEAILQMIYDEGDRRDDEREEREFDGKVEAL